MPTPREIVEAIQRDRGLDPVSMAADNGHLRNRNLRDLGNALKLLSDQLYNSDGHFLLELLQNADDNAYPAGVAPTVIIEAANTGLLFKNNEVGFGETNVEAICSIGESTKRGKRSEATGEKGIGFKAVFKISDRPEVHSGGFHFCFDRGRYGDMGLVTPEWLDTATTAYPDTETTIVLPYKTGRGQPTNLMAQVRPELLLFLRRLRRLRIADASAGVETELCRRDDGSVVEITHTTTTNGRATKTVFRFFRYNKTVVMRDIQDDMRPDTHESDVVVAIPIGSDGTVDGSMTRHLFAFLPVRESGLRFVTHADFVLNTSREDVVRERPWNLRLRDELGTALADSIISMQHDATLARSALRVLAKPASVTDPFIRPILDRAIATLKTTHCVPVKGDAWSRPDEALRPDPEKLFELVSHDDSKRLLGKSTVDNDVTLISEALDLLGVVRFQLAHLIQACSAPDWTASKPNVWFVDLYKRLEPLSKQDDKLSQLRAAAIVRLSDGSVVAAARGSVFRSLSRSTQYGFEDRLHVVDPRVLDGAKESLCGDVVATFLDRLDIRDADPVAVIDQHILPLHQTSDWRDAGEAVLVGHARFVRDHLDAYVASKGNARQAAIATLRNVLWLYTARIEEKKRYVDHAHNLYLGDAFGDLHRLQWLLAGAIDHHVVSAQYISGETHSDREKDSEAWASCFRHLGMATLPKVLPSTTPPSHVPAPPPQRGSNVLTVSDWTPSGELSTLMSGRDAERKIALLRLLDRFWSSQFAKHAQCTISRGYQVATGMSTFMASIRGMEVPDSQGHWKPLAGLYQPTENNHAVFGPGVSYLQEQVVSTDFIRAAGIVSEPTVEQVLARLVELSRAGSGDQKAVTKLYQFLNQHWERHEAVISQHFRDYPIVCVAFGEQPVWVELHKCCWRVPQRLREIAPTRDLVKLWSRLEELFCDKLEVRDAMTREEWVATLLRLSDVEMEPHEVGELARQVYRKLEDLLQAEEAEEKGATTWLQPIIKGNGIWTTRGEWWRNEGDTFADDDPTLSELFRDSERVAFVDIPLVELPQFSRLLNALDIRLVSGAEREPSGDGTSRDATALTERIRSRWVLIARLLYFLHNDCYEAARDEDRLAALRTIQVSLWEPLLLNVVLNGERRQRAFECKLSGDAHGLELLVDVNEQENWHSIGQEIGRWIGLDDTESFRLGGLLGVKDDASLEKLLKSLRVYELPQSEVESLSGAPKESDEDDDNEIYDDNETEDDADAPLFQRGPSDPVASVAASDESGRRGNDNGDKSSNHEPNNDGGSSGTAAGTQLARPGAVAQSPAQNTSPEGGGDSTPTGQQSAASGGRGREVSEGSRPGNTPPPTTPDRFATGQRKPQRSPGRLISYVEPPESPPKERDADEGAQSERDRIGRAAVEFVVKAEQQENRRAEVMPHTNRGYDIESFKESGESDRFIEVKGLQGAWGERGVTMSAAQFSFARENRDRVWLYVVEFADDAAKRKLWRIRDPASKVSKFGFDHGWRSTASAITSVGPNAPTLSEGSKWRCDDGQVGTIQSIKRSPSFVTIKVTRPDGSQVSRSGPAEVLIRNIIES